MLGTSCTGAPDPGEAGLVEPLGAVLMELSKGGGAKGINIDDVTAQLERLTQEYPFQVGRALFPLIPCVVEALLSKRWLQSHCSWPCT